MSGTEMQAVPMDDGWGSPNYVQPISTSMANIEMPINEQGQNWNMKVVGTIPVDNGAEIESLKQTIQTLEEEKKSINDMYVKSVTEYEVSKTKINQES